MSTAFNVLSMNLEDILRKTREITQMVVLPQASEVDTEARWPEKSLRVLQQEGLAGLVVPVELGGLGQGMYSFVRVCEIIAQACPSTSMCLGMHLVGTAVIAAKATDHQKKKYLEPIAAGHHLTSLALSEPGTGAHFYFPQAQLTQIAEDTLEVNGMKSFVTNGGYADSYVASTVAFEENALPSEFSCVMIDKGAEGLEWGPPWNGLGMRGNSSRNLQFKNLRIPAANLLGEKGDQLWYVFNVVAPYFLTAMAGTYLGIAQAAFDEAKDHLLSRSYSHSGLSLGNIHVMQHKLGMLWAKVERTRRLIYHAAQQGDLGGIDALPAILSAKAEVAQCVTEVVNEAMTLTGGISYRENSRLSIMLRDARAAHVMAPTTDILYTWLGRALLNQPILSD